MFCLSIRQIVSFSSPTLEITPIHAHVTTSTSSTIYIKHKHCLEYIETPLLPAKNHNRTNLLDRNETKPKLMHASTMIIAQHQLRRHVLQTHHLQPNAHPSIERCTTLIATMHNPTTYNAPHYTRQCIPLCSPGINNTHENTTQKKNPKF